MAVLFAASAAAGSTVEAEKLHRHETIYFSYKDKDLLVPGQKHSSVAYLATGAGCDDALPLLVVLHGINESRALYPWFGGAQDLRPILDEFTPAGNGLVVAAPSQTRNAGLPNTLWTEFRLEEFVDELIVALPGGCNIDRRAVFVAGHSAAGCNPDGGLATVFDRRSRIAPAGVAFIDTCFDVNVAAKVAGRHLSTEIWILWQSQSWPRSPTAFLDELIVPAGSRVRVDELRLTAANPHIGAMYTSVERIVSEWVLHSASRNLVRNQAENRKGGTADGITDSEQPPTD